MARNVEIKARIASIEALLPIAAGLADGPPEELFQDDTFFTCANGRLKLRTFSATRGELIFYRRADRKGPKESFYLLSPTTAPDTLRKVLTLGLGLEGRVRKKRLVFLVGRTRIHLDRLEELGDFLELEVVLADGEAVAVGETIARELMGKLGIRPEQLVEGVYLDMLKEHRPLTPACNPASSER